MRVITSQAFISALVVAFIFLALVPSGAHAYTRCSMFQKTGLIA